MAKAVLLVECIQRYKRSYIEIMLKIITRKKISKLRAKENIFFFFFFSFLCTPVPFSGLGVLDLTHLTSVNYTE
jgi:hypothetical protein